MNDHIYFLEKLIQFPSITPLSAGAIEFIHEILTTNGFTGEIKKFGSPAVVNLYAEFGTGKPNICFAGHVDVVPPGDMSLWTYHPFEPKKCDNYIYGRGAVDMKGAIACAISAALKIIKQDHFKGKISFLITSDEEGAAKYGTKEMLRYLSFCGKKIDLAILGEPTTDRNIGDTIKIGRRGSINFILKVLGTQGHVAYPELADNPITAILKALSSIKEINLDQGNDFFEKSNLEITSLDSDGKAKNVIPSFATATFNIRFNDIHTADSLTILIDAQLKKHKLNYELTSSCNAEAFIQQPEGYIKKFIEITQEVTAIKPILSTNGGTSDARFIKNYCPVVELGLPFHQAHKINENVEISDLQTLYDVYYKTLNEFLK